MPITDVFDEDGNIVDTREHHVDQGLQPDPTDVPETQPAVSVTETPISEAVVTESVQEEAVPEVIPKEEISSEQLA